VPKLQGRPGGLHAIRCAAHCTEHMQGLSSKQEFSKQRIGPLSCAEQTSPPPIHGSSQWHLIKGCASVRGICREWHGVAACHNLLALKRALQGVWERGEQHRGDGNKRCNSEFRVRLCWLPQPTLQPEGTTGFVGPAPARTQRKNTPPFPSTQTPLSSPSPGPIPPSLHSTPFQSHPPQPFAHLQILHAPPSTPCPSPCPPAGAPCSTSSGRATWRRHPSAPPACCAARTARGRRTGSGSCAWGCGVGVQVQGEVDG